MQLHFYTSIPGYRNKSGRSNHLVNVFGNPLLAKTISTINKVCSLMAVIKLSH
jgi:hypothetical protein